MGGDESGAVGWELRIPFTGAREEKPDSPGEYCLRLEANADEEGAFWIQNDIPLKPGLYRLTYHVQAESGTRYRAYVESWTHDDQQRASIAENAEWQTAKGGWEERSVVFRYPEGHKLPYLALQAEAPGIVRFSDLSITSQDAAN